jgi:hypothetical protein
MRRIGSFFIPKIPNGLRSLHWGVGMRWKDTNSKVQFSIKFYKQLTGEITQLSGKERTPEVELRIQRNEELRKRVAITVKGIIEKEIIDPEQKLLAELNEKLQWVEEQFGPKGSVLLTQPGFGEAYKDSQEWVRFLSTNSLKEVVEAMESENWSPMHSLIAFFILGGTHEVRTGAKNTDQAEDISALGDAPNKLMKKVEKILQEANIDSLSTFSDHLGKYDKTVKELKAKIEGLAKRKNPLTHQIAYAASALLGLQDHQDSLTQPDQTQTSGQPNISAKPNSTVLVLKTLVDEQGRKEDLQYAETFLTQLFELEKQISDGMNSLAGGLSPSQEFIESVKPDIPGDMIFSALCRSKDLPDNIRSTLR